MSDQVSQRELADALRSVLEEQAGADRYRHAQRQARRGTTNGRERPHPLEYDAGGFPIPQRNPSFVNRVARLLDPR